MATRKVDIMNFWGERKRPLSLHDVVRKDPILANSKPPAALLAQASKRSFYVSAMGAKHPVTQAKKMDEHGERSVWQITVANQSEQQVVGLPGKSAARMKPETIAAAIDPAVDVTGKRPAWLNQLYQPRTVPRRAAPRLRRFNGRHVTPLYVFGNDARQPYEDASYPWGCVGKVYNSAGMMGSGALVYGNIVVTAGHVVPWGDVYNHNWWMRFVPDYFNGSSLYGAGVESYVSDVLGYDTGDQVAGYDWAICKLYNPVGNQAGYFGFNGYDSGWDGLNVWTVLGYPVAVAAGEQPSWQGGIDIHDDDGDSNGGQELESNDSDVTPGDSGGPIFAWWGNDPRVVGVVSGQEEEYQFPFSTEDNNIFSSGSGFANLIAWGRSNWQ
ncbi:MAG: trypsin-like serine peptidase [Terriglobia bacterium]